MGRRKPTHLIGMLDLHHHRMVARISNIQDSLSNRSFVKGTVADEVGFLCLEAEAYRAFIHTHSDDLQQVVPTQSADDLKVEADSLYFAFLNLEDAVRANGERHAEVRGRIAGVSVAMLEHAQRCNHGVQKARAERLAVLRDLARLRSSSVTDWPDESTVDRAARVAR